MLSREDISIAGFRTEIRANSVFFFLPSARLKSLVFSSDSSPAAHSSGNLFIHLFEASLNSIWPQRPRLPGLPYETEHKRSLKSEGMRVRGRVYMGRSWERGQFWQRSSVKRVIIMRWRSSCWGSRTLGNVKEERFQRPSKLPLISNADLLYKLQNATMIRISICAGGFAKFHIRNYANPPPMSLRG